MRAKFVSALIIIRVFVFLCAFSALFANKMEPIKKKRAQNWTPEEKEILRLLIAEVATVIESKCNKTSTTIKKNGEWKKIACRFNEMTNSNRTDGEIKLAWKRMKLAAKANLSAHRIEIQKTGGGQKPPSPSIEDLQIMAIAPQDFDNDFNNFDSDRVILTNDPVAGPSQASEQYFEVHVALEDLGNKTEQEISVIETEMTGQEEEKDGKKKKGKGKRSKQRKSDDLKEDIIRSNIDFKNKHIEMLQKEHEYNIQIAKLKIKKLELQISLLEEEKKKRSKE